VKNFGAGMIWKLLILVSLDAVVFYAGWLWGKREQHPSSLDGYIEIDATVKPSKIRGFFVR
jgi:hypothetical protein